MDGRQPAAGPVAGTTARPSYSLTRKLLGFCPAPNRTPLRAQLLPAASTEKSDGAAPVISNAAKVQTAAVGALPSDNTETGNTCQTAQEASVPTSAQELVPAPATTQLVGGGNQSCSPPLPPPADPAGPSGCSHDNLQGCSPHLMYAVDALQQQHVGASFIVMQPRVQPTGKPPYRQPSRPMAARLSQRLTGAPTHALGATVLQELHATPGAVGGTAYIYPCSLPGRKHCPTAATMLHLDPPPSSTPPHAAVTAGLSGPSSWRHLRKPSSGPSYVTFATAGSRHSAGTMGEPLPPPPPLLPLSEHVMGAVDATCQQSCSRQTAAEAQQQLSSTSMCTGVPLVEPQVWPPASTFAYSASALMKGKAPWRNAAPPPGGMRYCESTQNNTASVVAGPAAAGGGLQAARARRSQEAVLQLVASLPLLCHQSTSLDSTVGAAGRRQRFSSGSANA